MKLFRKIEATGIVILSFLLVSKLAHADGQTQSVTLCDPLGNNCAKGSESFSSIATSVSQFLVVDIAIPLTVIMVLVGAFQIMTSGGDPEKFSTGRKTITYATIGLVAAFIALGAVSLIKNFLGQ